MREPGKHVTIQELGSLGEFIGAFAVVVTLIFVAVQVRQNTKMLRAQIRQSLTEQRIDAILRPTTDQHFAEAMATNGSNRELSGAEYVRLRHQLMANLVDMQNWHDHYLDGLIDDDRWRAIRQVIRGFFEDEGTITMSSEWDRLKRQLGSEFVAECEAIRSEITSHP